MEQEDRRVTAVVTRDVIPGVAAAGTFTCAPVVLLTLMTYVVMPLLTQLFRGWLYPRR